MRTVIVDDERLARKRLSRQLAAERDVELIAECASAREAGELLARERVDLLFLDVEMPGASGIELSRELDRGPAIIFVTAHEEYAVQAFEVRACDYLLKPVPDERLREALAKARLSLQPDGDVVLVRTGTKVLRVKLESIDWIEAAGNYVTLHVGDASHLLRETITSFEARLPAGRFARIHRAAIANLDRIAEFQPLLSGDFQVVLQNGARLKMSRTYRNRIRDLFGRSI
jgi:two-component system LytT family response regulator